MKKIIINLLILMTVTGCSMNKPIDQNVIIEVKLSDNLSDEKSQEYLDKDQYLPIGTIVTIRNESEKVMIVHNDVVGENSNVKYDYAGVYYPDGLLSEDQYRVFNEEHIEKVYYLGFINEDFLLFMDELILIVDKKQPEDHATGFHNELSVTISSDESIEFYNSGLEFPIGTVILVDDNMYMIIGYLLPDDGFPSINNYIIIWYPVGAASSVGLRALRQDEIENKNIKFLGYIDREYFGDEQH